MKFDFIWFDPVWGGILFWGSFAIVLIVLLSDGGLDEWESWVGLLLSVCVFFGLCTIFFNQVVYQPRLEQANSVPVLEWSEPVTEDAQVSTQVVLRYQLNTSRLDSISKDIYEANPNVLEEEYDKLLDVAMPSLIDVCDRQPACLADSFPFGVVSDIVEPRFSVREVSVVEAGGI